MDSRAIGRRVRYWRTRRNLTIQQFADRCGRSVSWVSKVESGDRNLLRLPMLETVAAALDISVPALTDDKTAERSAGCLDAAEVRAIRAALGDYQAILSGGVPEPPELAQLRRQVDHACSAWLASHFTVMGQVLPGLIRDGQAAVAATAGDDRLDASRQLVMAYRLASSTLLKFEAVEIAWLAADRAMLLASQIGDTICLARATRSVARAMTKTGQRREALGVLVGMADRMEGELTDDPELVSMYGMLLLPAEIAAASDGDADTALALHQRAKAVARRLGEDFHDRVTAFGMTNVALHRLSALVRLHEGPAALAFARSINPAGVARLPRERKANYLLDVAEAHRQAGQVREAGRALLEAERVAPEEVLPAGGSPVAGAAAGCGPVVTAVTGTAAVGPAGRNRGVSWTADAEHRRGRMLYVVVCGAGPAAQVGRLVELAQGRSWQVQLIATEAAREHFLDMPALEALTGRPVRWRYRRPEEPNRVPDADAVIVAPATYNTINKWAAGVSDTYPLSVLAELTGLGTVPMVVLPFVNRALAGNRVFGRSVEELRTNGVSVLFGPGGFEPHAPRTGGEKIESFPWGVALEGVEDAPGTT